MALDLNTGAVVGGRYRLDRLLGEGGMGMVWAATQKTTLQPVALKFLKGDYGHSEATRRRFEREARAAARVKHPNVVKINEVLELEDGSPVIVMELLVGESLGQVLEREKKLTLTRLARELLPAVSAVGTAHSLGIVHRDLKPDNIFLAQESGHSVVKVLDFGIAKLTATEGDAAKTAGLTGTGSMLGTPFYMSPEQAFGEKDVDHRADVWALGIIFYQCLSGLLPTRADNMGQILKIIVTQGIPPLASVAPGVPQDVAELIGRMLSRDKAARPRDLREVYNVLRRYGDVDVKSFDGAIAPPAGSDGSLPPTGSGPNPALGDSSGARRVIGRLDDSNPFAKTAQSELPSAAIDDGKSEGPPISDTLIATGQPVINTPPPTKRSSTDTADTKRSMAPLALAAVLVLGMAIGGTWLVHKAQGRHEPPPVVLVTTPTATPTATSTSTAPPNTTATAPATGVASATPKSPIVGHKKPPNPPASASEKPPALPPSATGVFVDKPPF
jgi:serine/threonine protein kinase